jgi:hypothetical protein
MFVFLYSGLLISSCRHHDRPQFADHMHPTARQPLLLTFLIAGALAHDNGMDMNMDQGMSIQMGNMITYLHFGLGDNLWFLGWAPKTAGAMFGTCFGLFMLAMAERWLTAMRGVMEGHWNMRFVPWSPHPIVFSCAVNAVPRPHSPTSEIPLLWRRLKSVPIHRRMLHSISLGPTHGGIRRLDSNSHTTSRVALCTLSSSLSTSFLCSHSCESSRVCLMR